MSRRIVVTIIGLLFAASFLEAKASAATPAGRSQALHVRVAPSGGLGDPIARKLLTKGEGSGPGWCGQYGGYQLGAEFDGVYACGPSYGPATPFDDVGFQCVELSDRFLWVMYHKFIPSVPFGKSFVHYGHRVLGLKQAFPGVGRLPKAGDIVSMHGDSGALPAGHTAVVTGVDVDSNGNGTIRIMEENADPSGFNQINVHDWVETYGTPGSWYAMPHISWLRLAKGDGVPLPVGNSPYSINALGTATTPTGINIRGVVSGIVKFKTGPHSIVGRPFTDDASLLNVVPSPSTVGPVTRSVSMNDKGAIAIGASSVNPKEQAYAASGRSGANWRALPAAIRNPTAQEAMFIDNAGDVAGWASDLRSREPTVGVAWMMKHGKYRTRKLYPTRGFGQPRVFALNRFGDAIGTERRHGFAYPVLWRAGRHAERLVLNRGDAATVESATMNYSGLRRTILLAGSSAGPSGAIEATTWHIIISPKTIVISPPRRLGLVRGATATVAEGASLARRVVGFARTPLGKRAFVWRPGKGMRLISKLVSKNGDWVISNATGINGRGDIAAQGWWVGQGHRSRPQAILLRRGHHGFS